MPNCKLYTNFAAKFKKYKIMKQKELMKLDDEELVNINWFLEYLLHKKILSWSETRLIQNWQSQLNKVI